MGVQKKFGNFFVFEIPWNGEKIERKKKIWGGGVRPYYKKADQQKGSKQKGSR